MKTLQLLKYVTSRLVKGQNIWTGEFNDKIFYTDAYNIWILPKTDNIFKDMKKTTMDYCFEENRLNNLELIDNYKILEGEKIKNNGRVVVGSFKDKLFYFDSNSLKYFDNDCKLYKHTANPWYPIYIKNKNDMLEGIILPIKLLDERKTRIEKSLGL